MKTKITIEVSKEIPKGLVAYLLMEGLKKHSKYECYVEFSCELEDNNEFLVTAPCTEAFFLIGMQMSSIYSICERKGWFESPREQPLKMSREESFLVSEQKLVHQLFIGKVADLVGDEKAAELLKDAKETFKEN